MFGSNIIPSMGLFHMLLAVAFPLAFIWTRRVLTFVHGWSSGMLVIHMTVTFLFCWPSIFVIFAAGFVTLPWPRVRLFMFATQILVKS